MWNLANKLIKNRMILGTAQYPSLKILQDAICASQCEIITVALRRQLTLNNKPNVFWEHIRKLELHILPNTAGCRTAQEAITTAEIAREIFETHWIKLEVIGDDYNLQPDAFELLHAAKILNQNGFEVFPYCTDDLVLCQRLRDSGCNILMPWAAPIGSGKGIINAYALETLRRRLEDVILIVDAGLGKPSHAAYAMELGFDGVLLNTAVSLANDPVKMASAFSEAVKAGRLGYEAGLMLERNIAVSSTPLLDTPFWHNHA